MVSKTQILHRYTGSVIYESDHQTVKECVEEAVKKRISLRYTDLGGADLSYADSSYADLSYADLSYADLSYADLAYADLAYADLSYADLAYADLTSADLTSADLAYADLTSADLTSADLAYADLTSAILLGCVGNSKEINSLFISKDYHIAYTNEVMQIGCENHSLRDWWVFSNKRILEMDGKKGLKFWKTHKELIQLIIKTCPATPTKVEA